MKQKLPHHEVIAAFRKMIQLTQSHRYVKFLIFHNNIRPLKCKGIIYKLSFRQVYNLQTQTHHLNCMISFNKFKTKGLYRKEFSLPLKNVRFFTNMQYFQYINDNEILREFFSNHFIKPKFKAFQGSYKPLTRFSFMN